MPAMSPRSVSMMMPTTAPPRSLTTALFVREIPHHWPPARVRPPPALPFAVAIRPLVG